MTLPLVWFVLVDKDNNLNRLDLEVHTIVIIITKDNKIIKLKNVYQSKITIKFISYEGWVDTSISIWPHLSISMDHPFIITFYKHYCHSHAITELWEEKRKRKKRIARVNNIKCYAMNRPLKGLPHTPPYTWYFFTTLKLVNKK